MEESFIGEVEYCKHIHWVSILDFSFHVGGEDGARLEARVYSEQCIELLSTHS